MTNDKKRKAQKGEPEENSKVQKTLVLFIATFFVTLFFLIFVIQNFTPQVDTEIVENDEVKTEESQGDMVQRFVDERLKWIQQEDNDTTSSTAAKTETPIENNAVTANENPYPDAEKDELVRKNRSKYSDITINETYKEAKESVDYAQKTESQVVNSTKHQASAPPAPKEIAPFKMTKVFVGNYSTIEQALSTQNRIMDSGLNVSPFIREINGNYTVQVGSFSSQSKALELINKLNGAGFYGRTVQE